MRPLPPVLLVTGALSLAAAALGLSFGMRASPLTETHVIEAFAADYMAETGGAATDCAAAPDPRPNVWLVVRCGTGAGARVYPVDARGRLVEGEGGPST